ncbi:DUF4153 domain-containing protein [Mycobacterium sp. NPDC003323]
MTMMAPGMPPLPPMLGPLPPRHGEPGFTVWPRRIWSLDPLAAAPSRFTGIATAVALIGAALWRPAELSIGYLVVGVMVFAAVYGTAGRTPTRFEALGVTLTLALLTVPGVLAADWVGGLCLAAAWVMGWHTLIGGHTWTAVAGAGFVPWLLPARVIGWAQRGLPRRAQVPNAGRIVVVGGVTVALVLVFGSLFMGADPAFDRFVSSLVPTIDTDDMVSRVAVFALVLLFVLGGGYLVRCAPRLDALAPARRDPVPRWEWALPLAALDVLFVAFVAVQAAVLFGGHNHVLATEGLTYAEYARQGFWQLLWVSALALLVIAVVLRVADGGRDRMALRLLVGTLCATSVVVVVSAIMRMWVYQQAYGFSTERLMVITIELWLGMVFVLVAASGVRMTATWLPRAALMAGVVALLGLAALNPERLIADRNIDRFERTGLLDAKYLSGLSADIDPAVQRLPEPVRQCVDRQDVADDPWYLFNLSRHRAIDHPYLADLPVGCEQYWPGFSR